MNTNMRTLYLNNSGSRWIHKFYDGTKDRITLQTKSGKDVVRTVIYWEAFGNFAVARISYKGKRINVFLDSILED